MPVPVSDMVMLALGEPIRDTGWIGFQRRHADGSIDSGEQIRPNGYVIPAGRCLVVTDVAYTATDDPEERDLTSLRLAIMTADPGGGTHWDDVFVTAPLFSSNKEVGGNVALHTGFAVRHGHYLTANLRNFGRWGTPVFVYGYLVDDN